MVKSAVHFEAVQLLISTGYKRWIVYIRIQPPAFQHLKVTLHHSSIRMFYVFFVPFYFYVDSTALFKYEQFHTKNISDHIQFPFDYSFLQLSLVLYFCTFSISFRLFFSLRFFFCSGFTHTITSNNNNNNHMYVLSSIL